MHDAPGRPDQRTTLGRYDLLARLGRGGMADVFLAVARGLAGFQKLSVLKVLRPQVAHDEEFFKMFLDEARLSANFSHPNVVHTLGVEEDGDMHFLVMEYLEGRSLAQLDAEQPDLPLPLRLRALADALQGLHYAHELTDLGGQSYNVVHRDVSPQNVFVTYGGRAKILDFGVAKARNALAQTREGTYKGKVRYMAPEQLMGEPLDRRADIFSAGILLWRALTGRRLWDGLDQLAIMHRLASRAPIAAPSTLRPDVPPALDDACARALSFRPADRFATAAELAAVLETHLTACGVEGTHRAFGRFLEGRYAAERARFRATIDEQLRALSGAPISASVPHAHRAGAPPSSGRTPRSGAPPSGGRTPRAGEASASGPPSRRPAGPSDLPSLAPSRPFRPTAAPPPRAPDAGAAPAAPSDAGGPAPRSLSPPPSSPSAPASALPPSFSPSASASFAAPRRSPFAPILFALLVIVAAAVAPWWPRIWPRLQSAMSKGAPAAPGPARAAPPGPAPTAAPSGARPRAGGT